jgi:hypothetical protein
VTKGPCPTAEDLEGESAPQGVAQEQRPPQGDAAEAARRPASLLDMLFREAEVIARNLKESGTRR